MCQDRLWYVDSKTFVQNIQQIQQPVGFMLDETVNTWQMSYFRFVKSHVSDFDSFIAFAAMVVYTTPEPQLPVVEWARTVALADIAPERRKSLLDAARSDCTVEDIPIPVWFAFDGPILDALEIQERDIRLAAGWGVTDLEIYRTAEYYYYLAVHSES